MTRHLQQYLERQLNKLNLGMRAKLIIIFLLVKIIPLVLLAAIAWRQVTIQGDKLQEIAVTDSSIALNNSAIENIERMTTSAAKAVADFLYERDADIAYLAGIEPNESYYQNFLARNERRIVKKHAWVLDKDGESWVPEKAYPVLKAGVSTNKENDDMGGFHPRPPEPFEYDHLPLYDAISFIDLEGNELVKVVAEGSRKLHYPLSAEKKNIAIKENTYLKAENYFEALKKLKPGEIYVSDVIGAYVGSNFIGRYVPKEVAAAAEKRGYPIEYAPEKQAFAGRENPYGQRFEGIVRWATPVTDDSGEITGYVSLALNHDHIMEFVDHITPMKERHIELPSADEGNYAFIWDYKGRNISHPRHHSIVGFDPKTGEPQVPWLEASIYEGWQQSGIKRWTDYVKDYPIFHEQSRNKKPAPALTKDGLVGLDCRYLNNAPQCTGWMDLTKDGGSGSFYILWSGLYKLNTAAAIPYYTGHYAPSKDNDFSKRGFGFVAIGSGLDSFTEPVKETEKKLAGAVQENLRGTFFQLTTTTILLIVLVIFIAIWMASFMTKSITRLIDGISNFRSGKRHFRFNSTVKNEFGTLANSFDEMADSIENSVKNPLCIVDMNGILIYANSHAMEILNDQNTAIGSLYSEHSIYPLGLIYDPILALQEGREAQTLYLENEKRYVRGVANYLIDKDGNKNGYIVETINVTEMVLKQMELEKAMHAANSANEYKGEFLARMSHEIRTPMNAIIGLTSIVQKNLDEIKDSSPVVGSIKENVEQVERSSLHLMGLLNDVLDLSKIEAGKISISEELMSLKELVKTVTDIIKPRCLEKDIAYHEDIELFSPCSFLSDSLRLRQVLINLLGNAVKFTPEHGKIIFSIRRKERLDGRALVEFSVSDSGIGISEEALAEIFRPFEQANGEITRQYGGTGLGLSISRHIVNLLGGEISVKSKEGEGSTFSFSLWLKETHEKALPDQEKTENLLDDLSGKRILLVDDVELNRKIVEAMLTDFKLIIDEAADGEEALNKVKESPENHYALILMDIQMPKMDGYAASRAIRALDRTDVRHMGIIALTANAFKEDVDKAQEAGMNGHIAKPFKRDQLLESLFRHIKAGKKTEGNAD